MIPFAVEIYRRYLKGESVQRLSMALGIPSGRIEQRIRAAEAYTRRLRRVA
jgi:hypothetical protein